MKFVVTLIAVLTVSSVEAENPYLSPRETSIAWAIQFAGEEGRASKKDIPNYPYAVAKAIAYGYRYPNYITPLFTASIGKYGIGSQMQIQILGTLLMSAGDSAFSHALLQADPMARTAASQLLRKLFESEQLDTGVPIKRKMYHKTYKIANADAGYQRAVANP